MSSNSFGKLFTVTTFGESHGPAIGCVVDGCPPGRPWPTCAAMGFSSGSRFGRVIYLPDSNAAATV